MFIYRKIFFSFASFIALFFIMSCGETSDDKKKGMDDIKSILKAIKEDPKEKVTVTKIEYYKDYEQSYQGNTKYLNPISKESTKGISYIKLYYSNDLIVREEEYDKSGILARYTKPIYGLDKKKLEEQWYDKADNIILDRSYEGNLLLSETIYSSGSEHERVKYAYDEQSILQRENHYDIYNKLLFYKTFDYAKGVIIRSHFHAPNGSKISTHREYYSKDVKESSNNSGYNIKSGKITKRAKKSKAEKQDKSTKK